MLPSPATVLTNPIILFAMWNSPGNSNVLAPAAAATLRASCQARVELSVYRKRWRAEERQQEADASRCRPFGRRSLLAL
jgi:hypothetical protein